MHTQSEFPLKKKWTRIIFFSGSDELKNQNPGTGAEKGGSTPLSTQSDITLQKMDPDHYFFPGTTNTKKSESGSMG